MDSSCRGDNILVYGRDSRQDAVSTMAEDEALSRLVARGQYVGCPLFQLYVVPPDQSVLAEVADRSLELSSCY